MIVKLGYFIFVLLQENLLIDIFFDLKTRFFFKCLRTSRCKNNFNVLKLNKILYRLPEIKVLV